ncbi:hypothetical protein M378DRAFT_618686 [Amanita muscaria Koide BX008]|uniref:Poly(A) polymerase RNA-binding domain-containing protein n=1 Tax=Amanita muscaria (strain Koide BX008) TaxID=946122 RepID=A0A0C2TSS5_AMAMK|nr:hypothetical protein M378DRAFT_618686 [Amanita muscaria Koide BX008]
MWEKYDEASMGIVVRHIKSISLPDTVFEPGERPAKGAQKRTKTSSKANNSPDLPNRQPRSFYTPPVEMLKSQQRT